MHLLIETYLTTFLMVSLRLISTSVLGPLSNFEKIPLLGFPVLKIFSPMCVLFWWTLKKFKKFPIGIPPLCVISLVCGVWRLWKFSRFPCVWELWFVETLQIVTQHSLVCGTCVGDFEIFSKKSLYLGIPLREPCSADFEKLSKKIHVPRSDPFKPNS